MVELGLFDHVCEGIDAGGLQLTGEGGFLPEIVKAVLERDLKAVWSAPRAFDRPRAWYRQGPYFNAVARKLQEFPPLSHDERILRVFR
jgi:hypothetical protein